MKIQHAVWKLVLGLCVVIMPTAHQADGQVIVQSNPEAQNAPAVGESTAPVVVPPQVDPNAADSGATDEEDQLLRERQRKDNRRKDGGYERLPTQFRDALEQDDLRKQKTRRKIVNKKPIPMLAPNGEQLVALVGDRYLTKPQLAARVDLILRGMAQAETTDEAVDRRIIAENKLLKQWVDITALSIYAQRKGLTASDAEVNSALEQLSTQNAKDRGATQERLRAVGFPEEQLHQEVRDGILVEKLVKQNISQIFPEKELRRVYAANPNFFLPPARAYAWQLLNPRIGTMSKEDKAQVAEDMSRWGKRLRKCKNDEDCAALKAELAKAQQGQTQRLVIQRLDWVNSNSPLPDTVIRAIFSLKKGDTSDVVESHVGLHVVKVFDREEEGKRNFEAARPMVEASLFENTKEIMARQVQGEVPIQLAAAGLNKWVPVDQLAAADAAAGAPASTASLKVDPTASAARVGLLQPGAAADSTSTGGQRKFSMPPPPPAELRARIDAAPTANGGNAKRRLFSEPPPVGAVLATKAARKAEEPAPVVVPPVATPIGGIQ
jgi:hypothetical protein